MGVAGSGLKWLPRRDRAHGSAGSTPRAGQPARIWREGMANDRPPVDGHGIHRTESAVARRAASAGIGSLVHGSPWRAVCGLWLYRVTGQVERESASPRTCPITPSQSSSAASPPPHLGLLATTAPAPSPQQPPPSRPETRSTGWNTSGSDSQRMESVHPTSRGTPPTHWPSPGAPRPGVAPLTCWKSHRSDLGEIRNIPNERLETLFDRVA